MNLTKSELKLFEYLLDKYGSNNFFEEEYLVRGYLEGIFFKENIKELWIIFNENDEVLLLKK